MSFRLSKLALPGIFLLCSGLFMAGASIAGTPADATVTKQLTSALEASSNGLTVETVEVSEIPGIYAVQFANGPLVYSTAAGDHFVVGDMFRTEPGGFINLAELRRDDVRKRKIGAIDPGDMIVFSPATPPRASITVFTDVTCFYCQKLHKEVPELNKRGVEVRYLAYPRAGLASDGYRQLASAWCSDNPKETLTKLKNKQSVPDNVCPSNPIASQYELGQELGVRGTPAIVMESGKMLPGYQTADELIATLGLD
jgi:thiol:disulfide interchange protein DsbC